MSFKLRINHIRRKVMHRITKSIGDSYTEPEYGSLNPEDIKKVLIIRPNHRLGNQLLLTPLVQEVINTFPNCEIDLFVKGGVAHPVFENYKEVTDIIKLPKKPWSNIFQYVKTWVSIKRKTYDLVINGDRNSSSGKLLTQISKAKFKVFGNEDEAGFQRYEDYKHISKFPVYVLRHYLKRLGTTTVESDGIPVLNIKLNTTEILKGKAILDDLNNNSKPTICIYTNATGNKCYSETWWNTFYSRLLKEFPEYNIIEMLPIENISKINFKAPNFYSKDIREMGGIIKNTSVFIAADNGVMHLASATLTPTVGFFSITNPDIYQPYGNGSIALHTGKTTIDNWIESIHQILD
ncbi:glycosyltransferase family 9 protein [Tamlana sp. 2201CG12-4]|uniref:glycosyltransferase family 9 protein n=1 Tax=Tamlana sp. 2201CG12-4 TaxID=3112582 RepID=UPI002DBB8342|nr:glycosyltransferase family 9 protein [Tamlana sp. 2201CG12-4]MEC3908137.1 glycosyltransferase family 9 protein [Tamlana sp. 2201CG12-4]